jgi:polynucleotide 5'-hydroxyl-kinase GRC3/NOL9
MISFSDKKDTTVIVKGPSVIKVEGKASVFGCEIKEIQIPEDKAFPVYFEEDSTLFLSDETFYIPVKGSTIPDSWKKVLDRAHEFKSFFIYGSSDSGKSSLATYLNNLIEGKKILIDLDIGQSSIAHPGAMGIGISDDKVVSISEIRMADGEFVGTISPGGREARCLNAVFDLRKKLQRIKENAETIIIDSTGWVRGRKAQEYKLAKLNILEPDAVLAFENPSFLDFIDIEVLKVEPFAAAKRSRNVRMNFRSRRYAELLSDAREIELDTKKLRSKSWKIFKGKTLGKEDLAVLNDIFGEVIYAEKGDDFLNIFVKNHPEISRGVLKTLKEIYGVEDLFIIPEEELIGLLVGLYSDRYLGFGTIKEVNYNGMIKVLTSVKEKVLRIEFGDFRLDDDFRECYVKFM